MLGTANPPFTALFRLQLNFFRLPVQLHTENHWFEDFPSFERFVPPPLLPSVMDIARKKKYAYVDTHHRPSFLRLGAPLPFSSTSFFFWRETSVFRPLPETMTCLILAFSVSHSLWPHAFPLSATIF